MPKNYFPKTLRLRTNKDFQQHFKKVSHKFTGRYFTLLVRQNNLETPRLGVSLTKKKIPHATDRNRIKRIIRESFRLKQKDLPNVDIIVTARLDVQKNNKADLSKKLVQQWQELIKFYQNLSLK